MIYDAVLNPQLWENVITEIVQYTHSQTGMFVAFDQLNPLHNFFYHYKIDPKVLEVYQQESIQLLDMKVHQPLLRKTGLGYALTLDWSEFAKKEGTDEYTLYKQCIELGGNIYVDGVLLEDGKYRWSVVEVHRRAEDGPYTQQECQVMEHFALHIRRALQIFRQLSLAEQEKQSLNQMLNHLKVGVILINDQFGLAYINDSAKKILEKTSLLWIDQNNHLRTTSAFQARLNQYISSALLKTPTMVEEVGGTMTVFEQETKILKLSIAPFSKLKTITEIARATQQEAIIFITEPNQYYQLFVSHLRDVNQLSKREIEICELFINGRGIEEIAVDLDITISTLRTYFRNIYTKTNSTSQAELMHYLYGLIVEFEHII